MPLPTVTLPSLSTLPPTAQGAVAAILTGYEARLTEGKPAEALLLCDKLHTVLKGCTVTVDAHKGWAAWVVAARKLALSTASKVPTPKTFPTVAARLAYFRSMLASNEKWALRALLVIFAHQTAAEKQAEQTTDHNGVGFSGKDAEILSSFAKQVAAHEANLQKKPEWKALSPKQFAVLHKLMPRYADQLLRHLEAEGKAPAIVKAPKSEVA